MLTRWRLLKVGGYGLGRGKPQSGSIRSRDQHAPVSDLCILLRGISVLRVRDYWDRFEEGYLVNHFRKEWKLLLPGIAEKRWTHVVNRSVDDWFSKKEYERLGVGRVLTNHFPAHGSHPIARLGIDWEYMPETMLAEVPGTSEGGMGYPTLGIQTVAYAAAEVHPKDLWIFGLDFYHSHYLISEALRKDYHFVKQQEMVPFFVGLVKQFPDVTFHVATTYPELPDLTNLVLL